MNEYITKENARLNRPEWREAIDDFSAGFNVCIDEYMDRIDEIPAADVVPARHGKWVKATGMMPPEYCGLHICSECGHYAGRKPPYGGREMLSDYCPNCGARMDGVE